MPDGVTKHIAAKRTFPDTRPIARLFAQPKERKMPHETLEQSKRLQEFSITYKRQ